MLAGLLLQLSREAGGPGLWTQLRSGSLWRSPDSLPALLFWGQMRCLDSQSMITKAHLDRKGWGAAKHLRLQV